MCFRCDEHTNLTSAEVSIKFKPDQSKRRLLSEVRERNFRYIQKATDTLISQLIKLPGDIVLDGYRKSTGIKHVLKVAQKNINHVTAREDGGWSCVLKAGTKVDVQTETKTPNNSFFGSRVAQQKLLRPVDRRTWAWILTMSQPSMTWSHGSKIVYSSEQAKWIIFPPKNTFQFS